MSEASLRPVSTLKRPFPYERIGPLVALAEMGDLNSGMIQPRTALPFKIEYTEEITKEGNLVETETVSRIINNETPCIFAKPGTIEGIDPNHTYVIGFEHRRTGGTADINHGFVQLHPESSDAWIVDWGAEEAGQRLLAIGRTAIPIDDYKGDFKDPLVIFFHPLATSEIEDRFPAAA